MPIILYKTGVYCILNVRTRKRYIGSAAKSLAKRLTSHRYYLRLGSHKNLHLQRAWNIDSQYFVITVLERCPSAKCVEREQHWIDYFKSADRQYGYNKSPTAGSPLGVKHSIEVRQKLSVLSKRRKKSASHAANIRKALAVRSATTRAKMSEYARHRTQEHLANLSESAKKTSKARSERSRQRWAEWKASGKAKEIGRKISRGNREGKLKRLFKGTQNG